MAAFAEFRQTLFRLAHAAWPESRRPRCGHRI